jgi:hypothetical protein
MMSVRKIAGVDGTVKLQVRLDLGVLQMELSGRPDGQRPYGCESLLEYFEAELARHKRQNGTEVGFEVSIEQCMLLREEAMMYYHRYVGLFVLEDYAGVVRDTARNLRVLDFCGRFAAQDEDRVILEEHRPHLIVTQARGAASMLVAERRFDEAMGQVEEGLGKLRDFFIELGQEDFFSRSHDAKVLRQFGRQIRKRMPGDRLRRLRVSLARAIKEERYEDAAGVRDEIERKTQVRG